MSPTSEAGDEDFLSETLFKRFSTSEFDNTPRKFMPNGDLDELITRASVLDAMEIEESESDPQDEMLVEYVLHKAKKVFAIAVSIDLDQQEGLLKNAMQKFRRYSIDDSKLPFKDTPDSILATLEPGVRHRSKIWRESRIHDFFNNQWRFLVPVFLAHPQTDIRNYSLPSSTIFPVINKQEGPGEGAFGKVFKSEIHPKHIKYSVKPVRSMHEDQMGEG